MQHSTSITTKRFRTAGALAAAGLALAACSETGARAGLGEEAANPALASRQARYQSVTAGHVGYRPVGPIDWRRANERVAPAPSAR
ncbi:hypothetical protein BN1110_04443 [bacterium YEK0313]|nr:hypothetical protein BN1110_04443 [bacterium YEK0313]